MEHCIPYCISSHNTAVYCIRKTVKLKGPLKSVCWLLFTLAGRVG